MRVHLVALIVYSGFLPAYAAQDTNSVAMTLSGKVFYPPPCVVTSNTIEVSFGRIFTDEISPSTVGSDKNTKKIALGLDCQGAKKDQLKIMVSGDAAEQDSNVLKSAQDGFGFRFDDASAQSIMPVNQWYSFDKNSVPDLTVTPVRWVNQNNLKPLTINTNATVHIMHD
ncbi:fimbrial protein [Enterobacter sp. 168J2]|uniref:fimbrial protein n=1 Tax=Enterobacter sp. 168J2 TaxID=3077758 RepID=UPI00124AD673|nr:fimbrial protein [Enterobacter sp. 168J2]MCP1115435.1 fimbrial protein [Enterobacter bugandensis]HBU6132874.1 fimbrial protein [Enterobacter cloacae]